MACRRNGADRVRSFTEEVLDLLKMFLLLFCMFTAVRAEIRTAVIDKQTGQLSVIEGYQEDFVAWANFTDDIETSG